MFPARPSVQAPQHHPGAEQGAGPRAARPPEPLPRPRLRPGGPPVRPEAGGPRAPHGQAAGGHRGARVLRQPAVVVGQRQRGTAEPGAQLDRWDGNRSQSLYIVVQLDITTETEVLCMLFDRYLSLFTMTSTKQYTSIPGVKSNWTTLKLIT